MLYFMLLYALGADADGLVDGPSESDSEIGDHVHDGVGGLDPGRFWDIRREWGAVEVDAHVDAVVNMELPVGNILTETVTMFVAHDNLERKLARQSVIKPGTSGESYSLYCYLHKCKICKKPEQYLGLLDVRRWFKARLDCPPGQAGQRAHMALWPNPANA